MKILFCKYSIQTQAIVYQQKQIFIKTRAMSKMRSLVGSLSATECLLQPPTLPRVGGGGSASTISNSNSGEAIPALDIKMPTQICNHEYLIVYKSQGCEFAHSLISLNAHLLIFGKKRVIRSENRWANSQPWQKHSLSGGKFFFARVAFKWPF